MPFDWSSFWIGFLLGWGSQFKEISTDELLREAGLRK